VSAEENKAIARRFVEEVLNRCGLDAIDEILDPAYVNHNPTAGLPATREGFKKLVATVCGAFDAHVTIEDIFADGDKVAYRDTTRATHRGTFLGIPATGKSVTWTEMCIFRIAGGKIVEHWHVEDLLGILQQLGAAP
jgi:predicted ester cyclase